MRRTRVMLRMLGGLSEAQDLMDAKDYERACDLLLEIEADVQRASIRSAHLHWLLGITLDNLGDLPMALLHIEKAIELDPLSVPFHRSFDIVVNRIRAALLAPGRDPGDASTPRLHELLVLSGEADADCHVAMARHHAHAGELEEAMRLLAAVTTLDPLHREAWALTSALARKAGDAELAERADIEAAATSGKAPVPFAIKGVAEG
ncbi:MAG: hypothetical protein ACOX6T_17580 [Myxococcales bacterium]|jgi:Flp pilus assembly protein TadD